MRDLFARVREALAESYDIRRVVGTGGMATVFEAWDSFRGQTVAIKVLKPQLAEGVPLERFRREVAVASKLDHTNIVPILTNGEQDGIVYCVMPFVPGETLRLRLVRDRTIPLPEAIQIAAEIAGALEHAHAHGIMHRDVKPENILLYEDHALVTDFGIARAILDDGSSLTITGTAVGTPNYMSPEQAMGHAVDVRTDIYSLGCVLYEMIAGTRPFADRPSPLARNPTDAAPTLSGKSEQIPPAVSELVASALEWNPENRPESATAMVTALHDIQKIVGLPLRGPSGTRALRGWASLGAAAGAVLAAGFLVSRLVGPPSLDPTIIAVEPITFSGPSSQNDVAARFSDETISALGGAVGISIVLPEAPASRATSADYILRWAFAVDSSVAAPAATIQAVLHATNDTTVLWSADSMHITMDREALSLVSSAIATDIAAAVRARGARQP